MLLVVFELLKSIGDILFGRFILIAMRTVIVKGYTYKYF